MGNNINLITKKSPELDRSITLAIAPRDLIVEPYSEIPLLDPDLLTIIGNGDESNLPEKYEILTDSLEFTRTTTRNLRLLDRTTGRQKVINGFGYTLKDPKNHQMITFLPPRPDINHNEYLRSQNIYEDQRSASRKTSIGTSISVEKSIPLGAFYHDALLEKIDGYLRTANLYPRLGVEVTFPELAGAFAYRGSIDGVFGLVYDAPNYTTPLEFVRKNGLSEMWTFVEKEFAFIRALSERGLSLNHMHLLNKGLTSNNELYIGDPQDLSKDTTNDPLQNLNRFVFMTSEAIVNDLRVIFKSRHFGLNIYSDPRFIKFIWHAMQGFGLDSTTQEDQVLERIMSAPYNEEFLQEFALNTSLSQTDYQIGRSIALCLGLGKP